MNRAYKILIILVLGCFAASLPSMGDRNWGTTLNTFLRVGHTAGGYNETIVVTDNESTNETNSLLFLAGGDLDGGNTSSVETDGDLNYNPSTGTLSVTTLSGAFDADNITGDSSDDDDLDVAAGGTGVSTLADGGLVVGNGGSDVEVVSPGATTEILVGGGAGTAPVWTTATGTGAPMRATSPTLTTSASLSDGFRMGDTGEPNIVFDEGNDDLELYGGDATVIQNKTDATTGFQILDKDGGAPIVNVDTTNERTGFGTADPNTTLDVDGTVQAEKYIGRIVAVTASADDTDVDDAAIVTVDTSGGAVTLGGFTNGDTGQLLYVSVIDSTAATTLEHDENTGNQDVFLSTGDDESVALGAYGGWLLQYNGTNWYEVTAGGSYLTDFDEQTAWRVFYSNTDGDVTELALGADGTFLKSNGADAAPTFAAAAGGGTMTTVQDGDVGVGDADIITLDFDGTAFAVTEDPDTEINIDIADDGIDSQHYNADSIDNEHINWADIDNLGDEGACTLSATATVATTVTITDNEDTAENNPLVFVAGGDLDGGDLGLETDGTAYYTPSTGTLSVTTLSGAFDADNITGDSSDDDDLDVAAGGTGVSTLTDGGVLLGNGSGDLVAMDVLADGQMIVGDGTTDPVAESGATLRTSIGVGTGDSPQFTGIELGHASDTTITKDAAGVLDVEGQQIFSAKSGGITSSQLLGALSNETGTGAAVFGTSPTLTTSASLSDGFRMGDSGQPNIVFDETNDVLKMYEDVRLMGSTSGYVGLKGAAVAGSTTYTLPEDGGTGEFLETDGSGNLSWSAVPGTVPDGTSNGDLLIWNPEGASEQWDDVSRAEVLMKEHVMATSDDLSAYEVTHTQVTNYGQAAVDVMHYLPTASTGLQVDFVIGTTQGSNYLTIRADTNDKIYLDGAAGDDGQWVQVTPAIGNIIEFTSFKTGASNYDWIATSRNGEWAAVTSYTVGAEAGDSIEIEGGTDDLVVE